MITVMMIFFEEQQLKATLFLGALGVLMLVALVFVFLAFRAQKSYDTEVLPMLPGMEEDDELLQEEKQEGASAFHFDENDELHSMGDKEAVDLLREMRAASGTSEKKKKPGLFGKKS